MPNQVNPKLACLTHAQFVSNEQNLILMFAMAVYKTKDKKIRSRNRLEIVYNQIGASQHILQPEIYRQKNCQNLPLRIKSVSKLIRTLLQIGELKKASLDEIKIIQTHILKVTLRIALNLSPFDYSTRTTYIGKQCRCVTD